MNMKRTAAALLTASTMMSLSVYAASPAADVKVVDDDTIIHNAQTVKLIAEEAELVIKGQVDQVIVTEEAEESEIIVKKGASVKEILVEGEETEISVLKGAKVDSIIFNGEEGEVEGCGTVGTVKANRGEAEIDVPGAKVIVGEDADEVEAGDVDLKPGDVVVINPDGEGVTPVEPETPEVPDKPAEGHDVVLAVMNADKLTKGQAIQIKCKAIHENGKCDFIANLDSVEITAPTGKTDTVMPEGAESVFDKIGYTVDTKLNVLTIGKDTLNQAFAHNEDGTFAAGEYTIALTAKNYSEKTVTVNVADAKTEPEKPEATLPAPEVADVVREGGVMGQYDRISFNEDVTAYLPAITSVTLNGAEVKKVTNLFNETKAYKFSNDSAYGGADKFIDFTVDCFTGTVEVVVTAKGYETLTFNVKDGKLAPAVKVAPEVAEITYKTQFMGGNYYNVSFKGTEDETAAFVAAINNVSINGQKVAPVASFYNDTLSYKTSNDPAFGGKARFVDFTEDCFKGEVEVVISADGYEDLTFTVTDGKLAK